MQPEVPGSPPAWPCLPEQAVEYRLLPVFFQSRPWRQSSLLALVFPFSAYRREGGASGRQITGERAATLQ